MGVMLANWRNLLIAFSLALFVPAQTLSAEIVGQLPSHNIFLHALGAQLQSQGQSQIDIIDNLNNRSFFARRLRTPRLGGFVDLPVGSLPSSGDLLAWEQAYQRGEIKAVAIVVANYSPAFSQAQLSFGDFYQHWMTAGDESRVFISSHVSHVSDAASVEVLVDAIAQLGFQYQIFMQADNTQAARVYATAGQRLAVDSRTARRYSTDISEFDYLGKRHRRSGLSLFASDGGVGDRRLGPNEPSAFLKTTLGDERTASTIREIVVPGGVALGELAHLPLSVASMGFESGRLYLKDFNGDKWRLPREGLANIKTLFDFVARSEAIRSDAMVDIGARGRVRLSTALIDTQVGYDIVQADTQAFRYIKNLPVSKSVIIDTEVNWHRAEHRQLEFVSYFEIRFLDADNLRIAQTRLALQYSYGIKLDAQESEPIGGEIGAAMDVAGDVQPEYLDKWGSLSRRLHDNTDLTGLGNSVSSVGHYAGWIALFRRLHQDRISFLQGRYEFMKIDNKGRATPSRI